MLQAFRTLHPTLGAALDAQISGLGSNDAKADAFLAEFLRSKTSKGEFAQELAGILEDSLEIQQNSNGQFSWIFSKSEAEEFSADVVPKYISDALGFLGVINVSELDEPDETT